MNVAIDIHFSSFFRDMIDLFFQPVPPVPFQRGTPFQPHGMAFWMSGCCGAATTAAPAATAAGSLRHPDRDRESPRRHERASELARSPEGASYGSIINGHHMDIIWTSTVRYCEALRLNGFVNLRETSGEPLGGTSAHGTPRGTAARSNM